MSQNNNVDKKHTDSKKKWIIILLVAAALIGMVLWGQMAGKTGNDSSNEQNTSTEAGNNQNEQGNDEGKDKVDSNQAGVGQEGNNTSSNSKDKTQSGNNDGKVPAAGEYEKMLAAAMLTGISIEYPDFIPESIYTASNNGVADHDDSKGTYVFFESNGEKMVIHSAPIRQERTEKGTIDISASNLGMATFDVVKADSVEIDKMALISIDDMEEYLPQIMQLSLYSH